MNFDLEAARAILCDHQESIEEGVVPSFTMAELMRLINHLSAALDEIERLRGTDPRDSAVSYADLVDAERRVVDEGERRVAAEAEVERLRETAIRQAGMPPTIVGEQVFRDRYIDVKAERDEYAVAVRQLASNQIGWFNPASKRFCYTDEKDHWPEYNTGYTVPVFAVDALPVVQKAREAT